MVQYMDCFLSTETCDIAEDCSQFGVCTYNEVLGYNSCLCLPGYTGDGYTCTEASLDNETDVAPTPSCILDMCWCPKGYELQNDEVCVKIEGTDETSDGGESQSK